MGNNSTCIKVISTCIMEYHFERRNITLEYLSLRELLLTILLSFGLIFLINSVLLKDFKICNTLAVMLVDLYYPED